MGNHWSRDMATLWWRDKGTGRMRVSFHRDAEKLVTKYLKLYHTGIDAALYLADGKRRALPPVDDGPPKKSKRKPVRKPVKEAVAPVPEPTAA